MPSSPQQQFDTFTELLRGKTGLDKSKPLFKAVVDWLKLPLSLADEQREVLKNLVCEAFGISPLELRQELLQAAGVVSTPPPTTVVSSSGTAARRAVDTYGIDREEFEEAKREEEELRSLLPSKGFFHDYCAFTENSEAPLIMHLFCGLAGFIATINRRVYFGLGTKKVYPPFGILILGPSGIKKTSAADIMVDILQEMQLTPIYAEKLTPEALVSAMKGGNATGLVYAPEMTVLVSKQKYMESLIPLLTRFMDSPDVWRSETVMRAKEEIHDVAITCLMCSTLDWFIQNTPQSVFGGGFIARNLMVLQEKRTRLRALPEPSHEGLKKKVVMDLLEAHELQGEVTFTPEAREHYIRWYEAEAFSRRPSEYEILETYYQRKPSHLIRFAMCLHLATHKDMCVCLECVNRALKILTYVERTLPSLGTKMFKTPYGEDQDTIIKKIQGQGGSITHSVLIRKMQNRMGSQQVRNIINNLKDAGMLTETHNAVEHLYTLRNPDAS